MGRIKSLMVKKAAKQLIAENGTVFTESFEHNKKLLRGTMPSKPIQNKVAGYIARLVKMKRIEKARAAMPKAPVASTETPQYEM